jgi:hypothetical protein
VGLSGAVLAALAIVYLIAWATRPGSVTAAAPASQTVAVTSVTRSCPPAAPGTAAAITMISVPGQASDSAAKAGGAGTSASGTATGPAAAAGAAMFSLIPSGQASATARHAAAKPGAAKPGAAKPGAAKPGARAVQPAVRTLSVPGVTATVPLAGGKSAPGAALTATGAMAAGFEAEQADPSGTGRVSCTHPSADMWFVGTGQSAGATAIWLYLMNTGEIAATADVTIFTDTGQQNGLRNAISVAPDQVMPVNITRYVLGSQALALQIETSSGQVAASVWEGDGKGAGAWLPPAAAPSTSQVIPGLTVASSPPRLFVLVPGATDARLRVVAYTQAGTVRLFTSAPVDASAGAATPVTLTTLGGSAAGLQLTANVPIVAAVQDSGSGIGAFTAAVPPVTQQGVVAGNPATRGDTVGVLLTAPAATATASISVIGADGTVTIPAGDRSVTVKAGHTAAVAVPRPQGSRKPFAIVITPEGGSGAVYAARLVTVGSGGLSGSTVALLPVQSALTEVTLPPAGEAYTAVLP